jgi:hypothetical protein
LTPAAFASAANVPSAFRERMRVSVSYGNSFMAVKSGALVGVR